MPTVTSLGHVGLYVRDIERSKAFYRDILGLKISDENPKTGSTFMTAKGRREEHHELLLVPGREDGKVVQQKHSVKLFDIGETGATERDLLHDFAVLSARHQQQLVMLFQPALGRHECTARFGILVADLQAKDIPIKCFGTLDVADVKTYMTQ